MQKQTRAFLTTALILVILAIVAVYIYFQAPLFGKKYIKINNTLVFVEIADTNPKRERGLGYRDSLDQDKGMLFVFDEARPWPFWMKGMRFPLDFIWIRDNRVVEINENVPTQTDENPVYVTPKQNITSVLEVNAGWVAKNNIKVGDKVEIQD